MKNWEHLIRGEDPDKEESSEDAKQEVRKEWRDTDGKGSVEPPNLVWSRTPSDPKTDERPAAKRNSSLSASIGTKGALFRAEMGGNELFADANGKPTAGTCFVYIAFHWECNLKHKYNYYYWENTRSYAKHYIDLETAQAFAESKRKEFIDLIANEKASS